MRIRYYSIILNGRSGVQRDSAGNCYLAFNGIRRCSVKGNIIPRIRRSKKQRLRMRHQASSLQPC